MAGSRGRRTERQRPASQETCLGPRHLTTGRGLPEVRIVPFSVAVCCALGRGSLGHEIVAVFSLPIVRCPFRVWALVHLRIWEPKTMKKTLAAALALGASALVATSSQAHFQLIYTPEVNLEQAGDVPFKLVFWHPFENGHVMDMGQPQEFFYIHKGKRTDLLETLSPISFQGKENAAAAFDATVPLKRTGDYIFGIVPAPYYEESEDIYIQQLTKSYVNRGGIPGDWMEPIGLETEIVPLNKPTNILAGSTFTGRVLANGEPVAGAEIEVEFMAAEPDMETNTAKAPTASPMPGGAVVAISDANGYFSFGIPRAGFWGFAALGSGPATEYEGKELSQDAVLWIRAYDVE